MSKSKPVGISAITAATMIATGSIGEPAAIDHQATSRKRVRMWSIMAGHKNGKEDDEYSKRRSISYAYGDKNSPFFSFSQNQFHQESKPKSEEIGNKSTTESLTNIVATISSSYAILLICIFIAFSFSGLVTFPLMYRWLDIHGFFVYLYLISNIYLLYLIFHVVKKTNISEERKAPKVIENIEVNFGFAFHNTQIAII